MARQTNAQLTDELIRLRAHSDRIEIELAKAVERNALLARQYDAMAADRNALQGQLLRQGNRLHGTTPAWKAAAERRRIMSRAYFKAHPEARSVTDEQLRDFEENYEPA